MNEEQEKHEDGIVIESLDDYTKRIQGLKKENIYIFRGQSNEKWPLRSAAIRRIQKSAGNNNLNLDNHRVISENLKYNENLVNRARSKGHGYDEKSRPLSDLEILALLQNYGAATALIDCTNNPYVALWFATEAFQDNKLKESNGKVFSIINDIEKFEEIYESDSKKELPYFLMPERKNKDQFHSYWLWEGQRVRSDRIIKQSSIFILGEPQVDDSDYEEIIISGDKKKEIRDELKRLHDIDEESMFPDFAGFSAANRVSKAYQIEYIEYTKSEYTKSYEEFFKDGQIYFQSRNYKSAIEQYTMAIDKNPGKIVHQAYCNRGKSYRAIYEFEKAITDFDEALKLNKNFAPAHYNRGITYHYQKKYDKAIEDIKATLRINPKHIGAKAYLEGFYPQ